MARQILAVPLRWFEQNGTHRILSMLSDDLSNLTGMIALIPVLCINIAVVGSCVVYMGYLNWLLLLGVLGFMAFGIITYQFAVHRAEPHFLKNRQSANELQKHYQGLLEGMKELKLHRQRREVFLTDVLTRTAELYRTETFLAMRVYFVAAQELGTTSDLCHHWRVGFRASRCSGRRRRCPQWLHHGVALYDGAAPDDYELGAWTGTRQNCSAKHPGARDHAVAFCQP